MATKSEMTLDHLQNAAKNYDNIQNEGGEGYNPYTQEIEERLFATEPTRTLSQVEHQLDRARQELSLCESATIGDHSDEIATLTTTISDLKAVRRQLRQNA